MAIIPFDTRLRRIQEETIYHLDDSVVSPMIDYSEDVTPDTKIPGLRRLIKNFLCDIVRFSKEAQIEGNEDIRIILSPIRKTKTYSKEFEKNDIYKLIEKYAAFGINSVPSKELEKALRNSITDVIDGEYNPEERTITIYYRSISGTNCDSYAAKVIYTLAHEYFHYAHHQMIDNKFIDNSLKAKCVKEALAEFFATWYMMNVDIDVMDFLEFDEASEAQYKERYKLWVDRFELGYWPYSYVLYLYKDDSIIPIPDTMEELLDKDKFHKVLRISFEGLIRAYKELVREEEKSLSTKTVEPNHVIYSANRTGSISNDIMQCIVATKDSIKGMDYGRALDYLNPLAANKRESIAPVYAMNYLQKNADVKYTVADIMHVLRMKPYDLDVRMNTTRRVLYTLALYMPNVYAYKDGEKEVLFWYSEEHPKNMISYEDLDRIYAEECEE